MQNDPVRFDAGDINLYRYCANDPVNFVDSSGKTPAHAARLAYWSASEVTAAVAAASLAYAAVKVAEASDIETAAVLVRLAEARDEVLAGLKSNADQQSDSSGEKPKEEKKESAKERRERQKEETLEKKHLDSEWEEPASEEYAKWKAGEKEKADGKDGRRDSHDKKEGRNDRSKKQIDEDYKKSKR